MKNARCIIALALTFMPLFASGQSNRLTIMTQVPFEFRIGDKVVPAGECTVQSASADDRSLVIRNSKAGVAWVSSALTNESKQAAEHYAMVFHKYGDRYFLAEVRLAGNRKMYRVPAGGVEKELRARSIPATNQTLLASGK